MGAQCLLFLTEDDRGLKPMSSSLIFSPIFSSVVMLSLACGKVIVLATIVHTLIFYCHILVEITQFDVGYILSMLNSYQGGLPYCLWHRFSLNQRIHISHGLDSEGRGHLSP